jgi:hypothetical protein
MANCLNCLTGAGELAAGPLTEPRAEAVVNRSRLQPFPMETFDTGLVPLGG